MGPASLDRVPVVYVAGSGHTGSTLVALLLDCHPDIVSVGEAAIKPRIRRRGDAARQPCSCGAEIASCGFWLEVFRRVQEQGLPFGADLWTNDFQIEQPLVHAVLTRESSHRALQRFQAWSAHRLPGFRSWSERTGATNVAFFRALLAIAGARVCVDTTKRAFRLARLLERPELDVKVVRLVRDVRAYVASAARRGVSTRAAASAWRKDQELVGGITDALPEERRMVLRYEDLCAHPDRVLGDVYRFCGVPAIQPVTSTRSTDHHVLGNTMRRQGTIVVRQDERWKTQLDAHEQAEAVRIAGPLHRRFGYA